MTDYELTRRDALVALAAGGAAGAVGLVSLDESDLAPPGSDVTPTGAEDGPPSPLDAGETATLVALARTIYPDAVAGVPGFVETYVAGRLADRPERAAGVADALAVLDEYAREWEDVPFAELPPGVRNDLLRGFGVDVEAPDPDGNRPERVRYYLVNELQFALYASPTGGELVGLENPQGYPGGARSYRRPPPEESNGRGE